MGLNYGARNIYISEREWNKYLRNNERTQLGVYYRISGGEHGPSWPAGVDVPAEHRPWQPNHFITPGQRITLGAFLLIAVPSPGHTSGHLSFLEAARQLIFVGDLAYNDGGGVHYLNFPDSSLTDHVASLQRLIRMAQQRHDAQILPSHGMSPLPLDSVRELAELMERIARGEIDAVDRFIATEVLAGVLLDARVYASASRCFYVMAPN